MFRIVPLPNTRRTKATVSLFCMCAGMQANLEAGFLFNPAAFFVCLEQTGSLVFCRVAAVSKDMETELTCTCECAPSAVFAKFLGV